jgi:hypothetical protein
LLALPVCLVVRLCTDEAAVVEHWNGSDDRKQDRVDVLDDFVSECREVYEKNPWLIYGLPPHCVRESGFHIQYLT